MSVDPSYAKLDAERVPFVQDVERDRLLEELHYVRSLFNDKLPLGQNRNDVMEYFNLVEEVICTNQEIKHDFPGDAHETCQHMQVTDPAIGSGAPEQFFDKEDVSTFAPDQPARS